MLRYCPANESAISWDHGITRCFAESLFPSVLFIYIAVFGTAESLFYRKYATRIERYLLPKNKIFVLQICLTGFLPVWGFARFMLQVLYLNERILYGYMVVNVLCRSIAWLVSAALILLERKNALPSMPTRGHSFLLLIFWSLAFIEENLTFWNIHNPSWWFYFQTASDKVEFGFFVVRYGVTFLLFIIGFKAPGIPSPQDLLAYSLNREQNVPLINQQQGTATWAKSFQLFWKRMKKVLPFLWPKKSMWLQFCVVMCILCLIAGRFFNLFVPLLYKKIVESLSLQKGESELVFRWDYILMYTGLIFLQGGGTGSMGFLNNLRSFLWIRVQQYTVREVQVELYAHIHGLSLKWHLSRKTGEVLRIVDRGTNSINNLLNYILFNILPTIADIAVAVIYFTTAFNFWFGIIVFTTMVLYLAATMIVTDWRTKYRREANRLDNAAEARAVDSLLNFETVKYYGAEDFEVERYRQAILEYQVADFKNTASLNILNTIQNVIITGGLLAGTMLCAHMVVADHTLTVGDYVMFGTYIIQLYSPLNWFGTYYRLIQGAFVDMENMFDLLMMTPDIEDEDDAKELQIVSGAIEVKNVYFYYQPERIILKNISFSVPAGSTVALVGPSGSGKSTIIRLLFRFYDLISGEIVIDQQNISKVKQKSLRKAIGVVPQDTVLFNCDIEYNIRYGRIDSAPEEVKEAAKAAEIHDRILTFPNEYQTVVGERGLKLSGGEKQRVAIARTILKSPAIVLLDEATSALDTQTERQIQSSLNKICTNRTTIIVAHRLSTIIHADQILVIKEGEIVERGSHEELLNLGGMYTSMWQQQLEKLDEEGNGISEESVSTTVQGNHNGRHH